MRLKRQLTRHQELILAGWLVILAVGAACLAMCWIDCGGPEPTQVIDREDVPANSVLVK